MELHQTPIEGAFLVEPERRSDDRGFFARAFCQDEFAGAGLETRFVQSNISFTARRGTLRGMHYQLPPHAEVKLVRCVSGAIHDVVLDLRPDSPTYRRWFGADLTAANRLTMYVPRGCAHGFIALTDDVETLYMVSAAHAPGAERGVRYDDVAFGIMWPIEVTELSAKDAAWPALGRPLQEAERLTGLTSVAKVAA